VEIRKEVENILEKNSFAPLDGLAGEKMINVLQVNLALRAEFGTPQ
jgi:K+-transporting ATPase ATPase C chain